ncbi:MAG: MoaD/ThiS family protein [Verrucomicrobia bacterium]|nr:MoaD/ThiS family protein [Verrucomicrobiota bacterium]
MKVVFLAQIKVNTGCEEIALPLSQPIHAAELWRLLETKFPGIQRYQSSTRLAVNFEFVNSDALLADEDEVALIPPVSGG